MDQQQQQQRQQQQAETPTTTTTASQPSEPQLPSQQSSQPLQPPPSQPQEQTTPLPPSITPTPTPSTSASSSTTSTTTTITPTTNALNPNPNSAPKPAALTPTPPRPAAFSRTWQQPPPPSQQHFSHFSSLPSTSSSSSSASSSSSTSPPIPAPPRGAIAIGVPAPRPSASSPQPAPPFSSSFGQQFGGLASNSVSTSSPLQVRPPGIQGGIGVMGSLGSSSQMRPGGISVQHHQQRPVQQSSLRPPSPSPNSQSPAAQNFQGQGVMRVSPVGSPSASSPNTSQGVQSFNQPWLSSGSQGKPPLPSPSAYRPSMNTPSMQQRSHIPQQPSPLSTTTQQQHVSSVQPQQLKPSHQLQEHYGQQFSSSRVPQSLPHQQQISRPHASTIQKSPSIASVQPNTVQPGSQSKIASAESDEIGNRILSKRSIHELVNQIDPSEKLDPEVEDILVDIAEDFVDSITTFGCSLAKHRKSDTLEAKDILLHLERNWNMTLPGFAVDEIKTYKKPVTSDIHKERLAAIKKSVVITEVASTRTNVGQAAVNTKGNLGKMSASIGST